MGIQVIKIMIVRKIRGARFLRFRYHMPLDSKDVSEPADMRDVGAKKKRLHDGAVFGMIIGKARLNDFHFSTSFSQLGFQVFGFGFAYTFFYILGSTVNQFFGFFQAQTGQVFHHFHNVQFGSACALQNYVESSFFSSGCSATTFATSGYYYCSSSGLDAVFTFQNVGQFLNFFYSQVNE